MKTSVVSLFLLASGWLSCLSCHPSSTQPIPTLLTPLQWASDLVSHCSATNTAYQHGKGVVRWKSDTSSYQSYTDCSGFLNALFSQSYHWNETYFKTWLGVSRPLAFTYYDAIKAQNHFKLIRQITDVKPGQIIAIKYVDQAQHDENTGHCMLISRMPQRIDATAINLPNSSQYKVLVIDSSESPHGKDDSRVTPMAGLIRGWGKGIFGYIPIPRALLLATAGASSRPEQGITHSKIRLPWVN